MSSRLTIGGVVLAAETHLDLAVALGRHPSGRRTLQIQAGGWWPPPLDAVVWTAPVTVTYADLVTRAPASLTVLSTGVTRTDDLAGPTCTWSLSGVEATGGSVLVTLGTTAYWATVQVQTTRSGTREVTLNGEGPTAPVISAGSVAVTSTLYTGTLTVTATSVTSDPTTGLVAWTVTGTDAAASVGAVTIGGTTYVASVAIEPLGGTIQIKSNGAATLLSSWSKRQVTISGTTASAPTVSPGVVAVTSALYSGNLLTLGVSRTLDPETGLVSWSIEGREP
ncbi:hypothetical protein [uncultured Lamprocystis sp.]|jgi:hypothetical protein|uniref:hypothetical protein n=1 Tax=uncultured Lamprocystis sp. TaxID=543132 RepID=UPI0025ECBC05|nr:hypothetical protein [uncultured Lamprocystis sp.]